MKATYKLFFIFLLMVVAASSGVAQRHKEIDQQPSIEPMAEDLPAEGEELPTFAGLDKYLTKNLRFPKAAEEAKIKRIVFVSFLVLKDGTVAQPKLLKKKIGYGCDEEALRLVKAMPKWKPGKKDGKLADIEVALPIQFIYKKTK